MNKAGTISEELKVLLDTYDFNVDTLSRYLQLPAEQVKKLSLGEMDFLPEEPSYRFGLFNKISFLYLSAVEDKDLKLSAFLKVLLSYHGLSKKTIAKMADVDERDLNKLLSDPPKKVPEEIKCRIAVTVMALRFFLKDCEQEPLSPL